jgi:hypothetical protein
MSRITKEVWPTTPPKTLFIPRVRRLTSVLITAAWIAVCFISNAIGSTLWGLLVP